MEKPENKTKLSQEIAIQTFTLISTVLGLVAALAWNQAITEFINVYIKPFFAKGSEVVSLFVYAVIITIITIVIALRMAKVKERLGPSKD